MTRLEERIRIGIVGLGWVGQEVARAALEDPRVTLVGMADGDHNKADRDLGELIGEGRLGIPVERDVESMLARARPEVCVVCTTSDVEALGPTLEACIAAGAHVVTTCENLADAEMALSQLEPGIDERVRDAGLVVLATGVNPGFAMDRLPVMLAQATRNIRRIRVTRVVDAGTRRAQLQAKIGVGMTPHTFTDGIKSGQIGHAGLSSSLRLIAKGLGIQLEKTSEAFSPVLAASPTTSVLGTIPSGRVRGIYQIARGYRQQREVITLELTMALDEEHPRDTIDIVGEPPLHFEGELPGDECTIATVLSAISVVVTMPPGLRTVLDVPLEQPEEPAALQQVAQRSRSTTQLPLRLAGDEAPRRKKRGKRGASAHDEAETSIPTPTDGTSSSKKKSGAKKSAASKGPSAEIAAQAASTDLPLAPIREARARRDSREAEAKAGARSPSTKTPEEAPAKGAPKKSSSKASAKKSSSKSTSSKAPAAKSATKARSSKAPSDATPKSASKKTASKKPSKKASSARSKKSTSSKAPAAKSATKSRSNKAPSDATPKSSSKKTASKSAPKKSASKSSSKKSASKKTASKSSSKKTTSKSSSKKSPAKKTSTKAPAKKSSTKKAPKKRSSKRPAR